MKIFITGIAGFLGANLSDYYLSKNFEVSGCDNLIGGTLENINLKKIKFFKADCENLSEMSKIIKDIDVVVHAAAYPHEGLSSFSPYLISKSNFTGSISVFTASIQNNVKRIVFCSSMARYGDVKPPFFEEQELNPVDPYGVSKLAAENTLKILSKTHNIEYNIAVPHNIIGPKQKYDDPFRNVVSIMTNLMLQKRRPIIYGDGEQTRSFSDIDDCIYCLDKLITDKNITSEIINIGPDEESITINELYKILCNKLKFNQPAEYVDDRPNEVKHAVCSSEKARKILNYKTSVNLNDAIQKVVDFIKSKGPKKFQYNYELEIKNKKTPETWKDKIF
ncbi:MAG: NAD-dependent epimerase/dehydratase family protein [Pelagibacterales bacterium]|nr:NAD-dependent epimerase/dehydratase family protein [Pelagibacterales bacterium]